MAIITYDPAADKIQGSKNGVVFSQSRSGFFVKARRAPTQSRTNRRSSRHANLALCAGRWAEVLTAPQRAAWNALGAATTWQDPFGNNYNPSGYNLFHRTNTLRLFYALGFVDVAPAFAVCTAFSKAFTWDPILRQLFVSCATATPNAYQSFFDVSPVLRSSAFFYSGPFVVNSNATGAALKADVQLVSVGSLSEGDRLAVRWRDMDVDGSLSAPQIHVFTIEEPAVISIQANITGKTFTDVANWIYLWDGSIMFANWGANSGPRFPLPVKCRLRHISTTVTVGARVGSASPVRLKLYKNRGLIYEWEIPNSNIANNTVYEIQTDIVNEHFAAGDEFSAYAYVSFWPTGSVRIDDALFYFFFQPGDFD